MPAIGLPMGPAPDPTHAARTGAATISCDAGNAAFANADR
jgi:hypothetical protein